MYVILMYNSPFRGWLKHITIRIPVNYFTAQVRLRLVQKIFKRTIARKQMK